jgi:hypothetical protein
MGERPGSMGIVSTRFHVDSSNFHAAQVTRTLVSVRHGLYVAFGFYDNILNCDVERDIPGVFTLYHSHRVPMHTDNIGLSSVTLAHCHITSPVQTQGLLLKKCHSRYVTSLSGEKHFFRIRKSFYEKRPISYRNLKGSRITKLRPRYTHNM